MPLTPFQQEVLTLLARNRTDVSHFAGGLVLNAASESARYSHDFDIFHELAEEVDAASRLDVTTLRDAGYPVELLVGDWEKPSTFRKARVSRVDASVEIDWAADSAFRFFPIENDLMFGKRLHLFDLATNKALTVSARAETRDLVDLVELDKTYPLEATVGPPVAKMRASVRFFC